MKRKYSRTAWPITSDGNRWRLQEIGLNVGSSCGFRPKVETFYRLPDSTRRGKQAGRARLHRALSRAPPERTQPEQLSLGGSAATRHCPGMDRFTTRPGSEGFSVFDVWTGEVAVIAMTRQEGLSREDADHTAELLNRRARAGDRTTLQ
jgi:hypothetical protein